MKPLLREKARAAIDGVAKQISAVLNALVMLAGVAAIIFMIFALYVPGYSAHVLLTKNQGDVPKSLGNPSAAVEMLITKKTKAEASK